MENLELFKRWNDILRAKASEYEHTSRKEGRRVSSPDIDDVCNEIKSFFIGLNN